MNGQNNNFNSEQNNLNSSNVIGPTQSVQDNLFSDNLINDANINGVGSDISHKVISWDVGKRKETNNQNMQSSNVVSSSQQIDTLFPEDLMNDVNATIIEDQPEILSDTYLGESSSNTFIPNTQNSSVQPMQQSDLGFSQNLNDLSVNNQFLQQNFMQQMPVTQNGSSDSNQVRPDLGIQVDQGWMSAQPLSAASLGGNTIESSSAAKDVVDNNKFFNKPIKKEIVEEKTSVVPQVQRLSMMLEPPLPTIDETELLKNFVRSDFTKINMSIFSFSGLIFRGSYFINRKLFLLGLVCYAFEFFILNYLPFAISISVFIIWSFLFALIANPLYLGLSKIKVKSIRRKKKNQKKNQAELNKICMTKGGTNLALSLLCTILFLGILVYSSMVINKNSTINLMVQKVTNYVQEKSKPKYDGLIERVNFDVEKNLNIEIPEEFIIEKDAVFKYIYSPDGKEENKICSITISAINGFRSGEDFLNQFVEYEKIDGEISSIESGDLIWYSISRDTRSFTQQLRATTINNRAILFEYNSGHDVEYGVCDSYLVNILDSLSLKKEN